MDEKSRSLTADGVHGARVPRADFAIIAGRAAVQSAWRCTAQRAFIALHLSPVRCNAYCARIALVSEGLS